MFPSPRILIVTTLVVSMLYLAARARDYYGGEIRDRRGVPEWVVDEEMPEDSFRFVRVIYESYGWRSRSRWATDYPDSELNFPPRLQELTSLDVNPDPISLELTDPRLTEYPFLYMVEVGSLAFSQEEVDALRSYLLNGGFLMVDDFWGADEYDNFRYEIERVFPDREPVDLPLEHPIFRTVFDLDERPQVPSINHALRGRDRGITWEGRGTEQVHYQGIFDDNGRMMCIICHNTDLGDGWEQEGANHWYFKEFSEKKSFPMGINIVFYALTN